MTDSPKDERTVQDGFAGTVRTKPVLPADPNTATVVDAKGSFGPKPAHHESALVGKPFGRYRILREIGRGGMGVVYEAHEPQLGRTVALKALGTGPTVTAEDRERFTREARICAQLAHPGIVAVHDVGEEEGQPFFTMELVRGGSLQDWINLRPLEIREAVLAIRDVTRAIAHAHGLGILHRDLKPSNILCEWPAGTSAGAPTQGDGGFPRLRVTDFGLGKMMVGSAADAITLSGMVLGTPAYMPPEQAAGKNADVGLWSDVYSLGAVLYELLTGSKPFSGESPYEVCAKVLRDYPPNPRTLNGRLSRDLETIVLKAMEKDPRRRYPTAAELEVDLNRFLGGEAILARPVSLREKLVRLIRREPRAAFLFGLAFLAPVAVALGIFWTVWAYSRSHDQSARPYWQGLRRIVEGAPITEAREILESSLVIDPENTDALTSIADLDFELGEYTAGLTRCDEAEASSPMSPAAVLLHTLAMLELGRPEVAREVLHRMPVGERDAPARWFSRALLAWLDSPDLRPPQPGFRFPAPARMREAAARRPDGAPYRKLRDAPFWTDLEVDLRLRETPVMVLLVIDALVRDGDLDPARELLERIARFSGRRPSILAWRAELFGAGAGSAGWSAAAALAQADRPELRLLAAEEARRAGDLGLEKSHREAAVASAAKRISGARDPLEAEYWRAWREASGR